MPSPVYTGSKEVLESEVLSQIDVIPSVKGYAGTSAGSTMALADEALRQETQKHAPELWECMVQRRSYLENELNVCLNPDILSMRSMVVYLHPLLLNETWAMSVK